MNKQRIKAFTIVEVTITMLLAAIVMAITYTAYSIVVKSYGSFNRKNVDLAMLIRLDELLKKDFSQAEIVLKDTGGVSFRSAGRLVKYQFESDFIVRTWLRTDTFKVKTETLNTSFENQMIAQYADNEEQNRLDDLELIILFNDEKIPYHYHKQYSSADLIMQNPYAGH